MNEALSVAIRRWIFDDALPFWAEYGVDRAFGGYVEHLRLDGTNPAVPFKRTRVISRQIYVFSHAAILGRNDGIALARHGIEFLTAKAWLGPEAGWARSVDREGRLTDSTADLYDNAFVLFALGWFYRVSGDPETLTWATRTLDFVDLHMRHHTGIGFFDEKTVPGPRKQNPHMHLLEAALVNFEASGDIRFRALADEIVELFCNHFFDPSTQTLGEFFKDDWSPADGDLGRIREPGHHFEWAWILAWYQRTTGNDMRDFARRLVEFAEANGIDPETGATFNAVREDGIVLDRRSLLWPNSERIQAAVAMFELDRRDPRPVFEKSGRLLLERYLSHSPRGTWINQLGADGLPEVDKIPASTLYHLLIAFAELLRVEEAVARAFPT